MNITLLTYGSRGDVQPFIALAQGLQQVGHHIRLAAPRRFAVLADQYHVPFVPLAGDPVELSAQLNDAGRNVWRMVRAMSSYASSIAIPVVKSVLAAAEDADLLVHSFLFTTGGHSLARKLGMPDVSVQLFPTFAPTRAFPMVALNELPHGWLNYFSHWLIRTVFWHSGNLAFRRLRRQEPNLLNFPLFWPFTPGQPTPLLFAYSSTVLPRPVDWTAPHIHVTGAFFLAATEDYAPPPQLLRFLADGAPPVCVSFGSMVNRRADRAEAIVRHALAETGQRGIILSGWSGAAAYPDPNLLYLDDVPHDWLLPHCQAFIHHGGAGSTATGLRAGIPNILIPHGMDQPFWGRRVAALGAGPQPIDLSRLTVKTLAEALTQTQQESQRQQAQEIGRLISAEDGVGEAVRIINQAKLAYKRG